MEYDPPPPTRQIRSLDVPEQESESVTESVVELFECDSNALMDR